MENKHAVNSRGRTPLPYDPEMHARFKGAMKEAGFQTITQIHEDLIWGGADRVVPLSRLSSLARGSESPLALGKFRQVAQEVAAVLNCSPEELFGCDPWLEAEEELAVNLADPVLKLSKDGKEVTANMFVSNLDHGEDRQDPMEIAIRDQMTIIQADMLATLKPREAEVLRLRFGLEGEVEHTLEEIGEHWGLSIERIRQIEAKALRILRHPSRSGRLKGYSPRFEND